MKRLSVNINERTVEQLHAIAAATGRNYTDITRSAVELFNVLSGEQDSGSEIHVHSPDGKVQVIKIL